MCDSCAERAAQLRELAACFETMAAQENDPIGMRRLHHTAASWRAPPASCRPIARNAAPAT
jgi:hypothetical protein